MKKAKICFIAQFPPPIHGLSKAVESLYNSELQNEFDFEKVDITNNKRFFLNLMKIFKSKAELYYFTISQTKGGNLRDLIILKLLAKQKKNCLIHLHGGYYRKLVDNDLSKWQRAANYKAIKDLQGAIVLGNSLRSSFENMIDDDKILIVPNCVDDKFLMSDKEYKEKINKFENKEVLHVLYLSNFIRSKGYSRVLEMAKLEKQRVIAGGKKQFHFNFAGRFFEKSEQIFFESYISENEMHEYVTYHGVIDGQQKRDLLKKCDIFMLLTNYPNEGQPISILEAMGNGMIIIATDYAGIPDIVENGVNGILVNQDKTDSEIFENLCCNVEMIQNNRDKVKMYYSESNYINKFRHIFYKGQEKDEG